jgi:hypothetical protein
VCCVPDKQQCQLQTWNLLENLSYWRALSNGLVLHRECKLTSQQRLRKGGGRLLEYLPLLDNLNARTSLQAPLYCYKRCLMTHFELLLILDGNYSHNVSIHLILSTIIYQRLFVPSGFLCVKLTTRFHSFTDGPNPSVWDSDFVGKFFTD